MEAIKFSELPSGDRQDLSESDGLPIIANQENRLLSWGQLKKQLAKQTHTNDPKLTDANKDKVPTVEALENRLAGVYDDFQKQADDMNERIGDAEASAEGAKATANSALGSAGSACRDAQAAMNEATTASNKATEATVEANSAKATAESALEQATEAKTVADTANATATEAQSMASSAKDIAESAQNVASEARSLATIADIAFPELAYDAPLTGNSPKLTLTNTENAQTSASLNDIATLCATNYNKIHAALLYLKKFSGGGARVELQHDLLTYSYEENDNGDKELTSRTLGEADNEIYIDDYLRIIALNQMTLAEAITDIAKFNDDLQSDLATFMTELQAELAVVTESY